MEHRVAHQSLPSCRVPFAENTGASRRSMAAFLSPGPCFRMRDGGLFALFIQPAFASLHPHLVQPSKADPHSRAGRLPGASRRRGYEPRPQAPHRRCRVTPGIVPGLPMPDLRQRHPRVAPSSKRLAKTPLVEPGIVEYSPLQELDQGTFFVATLPRARQVRPRQRPARMIFFNPPARSDRRAHSRPRARC